MQLGNIVTNRRRKKSQIAQILEKRYKEEEEITYIKVYTILAANFAEHNE
jgi:hypothetical protein